MNIVGRLTENAQVQTLSNGTTTETKQVKTYSKPPFLTVLIGSVRELLRTLPKAHWLNWKDEYRHERGSIVRESLKQA